MADRVCHPRHRVRRRPARRLRDRPGPVVNRARGYFVEGNPLLAQITDPVTRQALGFALKVALVIFVVGVARLQRRRAIGAALLLLGTMAGLFGTWSNLNPWGW